MRILLFFIPVFLFGSLFGEAQHFEVYKEDTINYVDINSEKQGKWIFFKDETTEILLEGNFINGEKDGIWISYYPDGKIKSEISYLKGEKNGYAKIFFENGNTAEEGTWQIDRWVGKYNSYYKNGKLFYAFNYDQQGTRSGYQQYFYENGNIKIEGTWEKGKESGIIKDYYSDGSLRTEKVFPAGKIQTDPVKDITINEQPSETGSSKKNEQVKVFTGTGYYVLYNINKQIEKEGRFSNGLLIDGKQIIYDEKGEILQTLIFEKGKIIEKINAD